MSFYKISYHFTVPFNIRNIEALLSYLLVKQILAKKRLFARTVLTWKVTTQLVFVCSSAKCRHVEIARNNEYTYSMSSYFRGSSGILFPDRKGVKNIHERGGGNVQNLRTPPSPF